MEKTGGVKIQFADGNSRRKPKKARSFRSRKVSAQPVRIRHLTVTVGKVLPRLVSHEAILKIAYVNLQFQDSKRLYKTQQDPADVICSIKRVDAGVSLGEQIHFHLWFKGRDEYFGGEGTVNLDMYVPPKEWSKVDRALAVEQVQSKLA